MENVTCENSFALKEVKKVIHLYADGTDLEGFFLECACHGNFLSSKIAESKEREKEMSSFISVA